MSKVNPKPTEKYVQTEYVTADKLVRHYGVSALSEIPNNESYRYEDYVEQANKLTEAVLYRYLDKLPMDVTDEARIYAESLAMSYAKWLKAVDDGANNAQGLKELWEQFRDSLVETLKSQPKDANKRILMGTTKPLGFPPYSQTGPGFVDIL